MPTQIVVLAHLKRYCSLHLCKPTIITLPQTSSEHIILTPNLLWWLTDCSGPHHICPHCPSRNSPGPGNGQLSTSHSLDFTRACRRDLHLHACLWSLREQVQKEASPSKLSRSEGCDMPVVQKALGCCEVGSYNPKGGIIAEIAITPESNWYSHHLFPFLPICSAGEFVGGRHRLQWVLRLEVPTQVVLGNVNSPFPLSTRDLQGLSTMYICFSDHLCIVYKRIVF